MRTSPTPSRVRHARFAVAILASASVFGAVASQTFAHADDGAIVLPNVPTTVAPTTTLAPTTTVTPVTAPPTSVPTTDVTTTTAAPVTAPPTTAPVSIPTVTTTPPPTTKKPTPKDPGNPNAKGATRVEVDISQQRLYIYKGSDLYRSIHVSTGSGKHYCTKGRCGTAHTPRGRFRVYNRINGWRTSFLGRLYNPLYFTGGFAIHGAASVPNYPASHGCVRVTMANARWLPSAVPNGAPVWVHD